jgi:hypothetical protein
MDDAMCPHTFMYITVLRDPITRIESHLLFHGIPAKHPISLLKRPSGQRKITLGDDPVIHSYAAFDNYHVRVLCGAETFLRRPAGALTRVDLGIALARLELFEVVLILEELEAGKVQLERIVGWSSSSSSSSPWSRSGAHAPPENKIKKSRKTLLTDTQRTFFREQNQLDLELYAAGVERSRGITASVMGMEKLRRLQRSLVSRETSPSGEWAQLWKDGTSQEEQGECPRKFKGYVSKLRKAYREGRWESFSGHEINF